jgi:hypothetical protein
LVAASLFGKEIYQPIEQVSTGNILRFENSDRATVFGAELEVQKDLSFVQALNHVSANANFAIIRSQVGLDPSRIGQLAQAGVFETNRRLQAQPDYTFNFSLIYDNDDVGLSYGAFYNVVGPLLYAASGNTSVSDVFQKPFATLDAFVSKSFFDGRISLTFRASNLLNSRAERYYDSPRREEYSSGGSGVSYSVSLGGEW